MRKVISFIFLVVVYGISFSQTSITAYHLKGKVGQNFIYNPAEKSDYRFNMSLLPSVEIAFNNFASFDDVLTLSSTGDSYTLGLQDVFLKIEGDRFTNLNFNLNLFNLNFTTDKMSYGFFINTRSNLDIGWPISLIKLLGEGNGGDNLGKTLGDDVYFSLLSYNEIGVNFSKTFMEEALNIGVNVKYLLGNSFSDLGENGINYGITTDPDTFDITLEYKNYMVRGNNFFSSDNSNEFSLEDLLFKGSGFSVDIGAVYNLNKLTNQPLKVGLSVLDISSGITWADANVEKAENVSISLDKTTFTTSNNNSFEEDLIPTTTTSKESVTIAVPTKLLGSVSYDITENDALYLTNYTTFGYNTINNIAVAYTRNLLTDHVNLTINLAKKTEQPISFGAGLSTVLAGMQIYMTTDDLSSIFNVSSASQVRFLFGINFAFSRRGVEKKKKGGIKTANANSSKLPQFRIKETKELSTPPLSVEEAIETITTKVTDDNDIEETDISTE